MNRRRLLSATGAGLTVGLAGCADDGGDEPAEPAPSELRIAVENADDEAQTVTFLLRVTRDRSTVVEAFETGRIQPGERWERDPQTLDPGSFELDAEIPGLSMQTMTTWTGEDCPIKTVDLEIREDGFRIRSDCPEE